MDDATNLHNLLLVRLTPPNRRELAHGKNKVTWLDSFLTKVLFAVPIKLLKLKINFLTLNGHRTFPIPINGQNIEGGKQFMPMVALKFKLNLSGQLRISQFNLVNK